MKSFKIILAIILVIVLGSFQSMGAYAMSLSSVDVQYFDVISLNTNTGVQTIERYDTYLTAAAKNRGITEMSTPAYYGTDPVAFDAANVNDGMVSPRSIIGGDNRIRVTSPKAAYPYRAICRIVSYWDKNDDGVIDSGINVGTGFLEGPSAVVTAGHCIYDVSINKWCEYAIVTLAQNGPADKPYGTLRSTVIHTSVAWTESGDWNQDWAVIELAEDIGYTTGWLGKMWSAGSLNGTAITVTGYPNDIATSLSDKNNTNVYGKGMYMWYCNGSITNSLSARLEYNADAVGGQSGAPVYKEGGVVVAIHTYSIGTSVSGGTRITEWLYNYLVQYQQPE